MTENTKENSDEKNDLPIFVKWMDFLKWIMTATEKFPKKVRFTFADRIIVMALDIVEDLIEARYTKNKIYTLQKANLRLEKLRVLMRISFESKFLPHQAYKHAMYSINEIGKMIGGWMKQQKETKK
jgi:four helix bundle protein